MVHFYKSKMVFSGVIRWLQNRVINSWFDCLYFISDPNMDGIDQWDSLRTAAESKRSEFIYNIDDLKPEICGHAAIRYILGCYSLHNFICHCFKSPNNSILTCRKHIIWKVEFLCLQSEYVLKPFMLI